MIDFAKILKTMPHQTSQTLPAQIRGLTCRSGAVEPGFVFFAIDGHKRTGGDFVFEAAQRGAVAVVSETPLACELPVVRVDQIRQAMARAACAFYEHHSRNFYLYVVTGTNGKTTLN